MEAEPCPRPEHPNPLFQRREWRSLNGAWEFCIRPAKDGKHPPESWEAEILVPFCLQSPLSGALGKLSVKRKRLLGLAGPPCAPGLGKRYELLRWKEDAFSSWWLRLNMLDRMFVQHETRLWYRRCLQLPSNWRSGRQRVILHIGACDYTCILVYLQ